GGGESALDQFGLQLFRPVQPMLAQTAEDAAAALEEIGEASLEFKLDGARVQAHRSGDDVRIYSRALNDVTSAVPELVEAVRALRARGASPDGKSTGLAPGGRPRPFRVTARRFGRKVALARVRAELPLVPAWFDLLYFDGAPLVNDPQSQRFAALRSI